MSLSRCQWYCLMYLFQPHSHPFPPANHPLCHPNPPLHCLQETSPRHPPFRRECCRQDRLLVTDLRLNPDLLWWIPCSLNNLFLQPYSHGTGKDDCYVSWTLQWCIKRLSLSFLPNTKPIFNSRWPNTVGSIKNLNNSRILFWGGRII